jgi:hypothetical protein
MIRILPIKVQVGSSIETMMSQELLKFYSEIACEMFSGNGTGSKDTQFLRSGFECSITWTDCVRHRDLIHQKILDRVGSIISDILIIDISGNRLSVDGLVCYSLIAVDEVLQGGFCDKAVILTSEMPSQILAFLRPEGGNLPTYDILIVSTDSDPISCGGIGSTHAGRVRDLFNDFQNTLSLDYSKRLSSKCIRRHGHFQFADRGTGRVYCTDTSYLIWDSEDELAVIIERLVKALPYCAFIICDCEGSQDLKKACVAVATRMDIEVSRFNTLIENNDRQADFQKLGCGIVIVDFVVTGTRMATVLKKLRELNIPILNRAYTAVGHAEVMAIPGIENIVQAFVVKPKNEIVNVDQCEQCAHGLAKDKIIVEASSNINSYTMHKLVHSAGWEHEISDEIPVHRKGINYLPNFGLMLANAGDWLGYKIRRKLDEIELGPDVLLLYLEQRDSTLLIDTVRESQRLRYTSLAVPQGVLDRVGKDGSWHSVLDADPAIKNEAWFWD